MKTIKQNPHSPGNSIKIETPFNCPSKDIFPYTYIYLFIHSQGSWSWPNELTFLLAISIYQHLITTILEIRSTVNKHWPQSDFMLRGNSQGSVTHARKMSSKQVHRVELFSQTLFFATRFPLPVSSLYSTLKTAVGVFAISHKSYQHNFSSKFIEFRHFSCLFISCAISVFSTIHMVKVLAQCPIPVAVVDGSQCNKKY